MRLSVSGPGESNPRHPQWPSLRVRHRSAAPDATPAHVHTRFIGGYCRISEEGGSRGRASQGEGRAMAERGQRTCSTLAAAGPPARGGGARLRSAGLRGRREGSGKEIGKGSSRVAGGNAEWRVGYLLHGASSWSMMRLVDHHRFLVDYTRKPNFLIRSDEKKLESRTRRTGQELHFRMQ